MRNPYCVKFEQKDMDGRPYTSTECFETAEARGNFIAQTRASAKYLNLPFKIIKEWRKE